MLQFDLLTADPPSHARRGSSLNHGVVRTHLRPLGAYGTVKGVMPRSLEEMGAPSSWATPSTCGCARGWTSSMKSFGGLHRFEKWDALHPDSGASRSGRLGAMRKITEEGVTLRARSAATTLHVARGQHADPDHPELGHRDAARRVHAVRQRPKTTEAEARKVRR